MPTDDERRAVARRLRGIKDTREGCGHDLCCDLWSAVFDSDYRCTDLCDECEAAVLDSLADLIEPSCDRDAERTCRVGCYPPGYEDNLHYEVCSECGTILTASRPGDSHAARASYCPFCGAKVMDE